MATNHLMRVQVAPGILWLWQNGYAAACDAALCGFKVSVPLRSVLNACQRARSTPSVTLMIRDQEYKSLSYP